MNAWEQRFIAASSAFGVEARDLQPVLEGMASWLADLVQVLGSNDLDHAGLRPDSTLARQVQALNREMKSGEARWAVQWAELQPAQSLASAFDDKVMLLVFGKFNAGKSSLCNFLAERFRRQGHSARFFRLDAGQIVDAVQCFHEGATETTAHLQGVCLGERLVLLDTPGLHSVTEDNGDLTRRFLDSADAVLWLTSSTSPGQVQELDELGRELRRGKPLLPIVTRSDCIEEDEIDGKIVKCLRNKTQANRALQEVDVRERALDKLRTMNVDTAWLKASLSLSVHMASTQGQTADAMADAGFERLYAALLDIAEPASAYKQRKPAEVMMHHLQEHVLGDLQSNLVPALEDLRQVLHAERDALESREARIVQRVWREVIPELQRVLEQHAPHRDVQAACADVERLSNIAFERQASELLCGYVVAPAVGPVFEVPAGAGYEVLSTHSVDAGMHDLVVGYVNLHAALAHAVHERLVVLSANAVNACGDALHRLDRGVERMLGSISTYACQLSDMTRRLRGGDDVRLSG
ncbi:hypothetical protein G7047_12790 [Diaphorobacter sp. HDW4A]|uniref:dynamin family protein n=1 Tax=Diaphorobacter sp. HDW4A TaxID=2714924 RepID=UPI0014075576|nr:dynamin family protein [Diaphorobacter sp. HDW4A]QIL80680.1 hypothetical protein G7047_12790 [Diaphorobacter sp. HDW4A]